MLEIFSVTHFLPSKSCWKHIKYLNMKKKADNNNKRKCETVVSHMTISQVNNKIKAASLHFTLSLLCCCCCCNGCLQVAHRRRRRACVSMCALKYCSTLASDGWLPTLLERWLWMLIDLTPSSCLDEFLLSTFLSSACLLKVLLFFGYFTHKT